MPQSSKIEPIIQMNAILELQDLDHSESYERLSPEEQKWYTLAKEKLKTQTFTSLKPLNPLAIPKSRHTSCEICNKRATLQCLPCRGHWCSFEHFLLDSESIHFCICPKLAEVWAMSFVPGKYESIVDIVKGQTETSIQLGMLKEICELVSEAARDFISNKQFLMAISPAIRYMHLAEQLYSTTSFEYVQANTLMVRAHLGLEKYMYVQSSLPHLKSSMYCLLMLTLTNMGYGKYRHQQSLLERTSQTVRGFDEVIISLQLAFLPIWVVSRLPKEVIRLLSTIYHISGTMFIDSNHFPEALDDYSHAAYLLALAYGPTSLEITSVYYGIASVFIKKAQLEIEKDSCKGAETGIEVARQPEHRAKLQESIDRLIHHNKAVQQKCNRPSTASVTATGTSADSTSSRCSIPRSVPRPNTAGGAVRTNASASIKPPKSKSKSASSKPPVAHASLSIGDCLSDNRVEYSATDSSSASIYNLKRFDRHLEESHFELIGDPSARFHQLGGELKRGINILRLIVDIWAIAIRRQLNRGRTLDFPISELGNPKSMLLEIQTIYELYLGEDTFEYGHVSFTLALFYAMYDHEFDGYYQAKKANAAFTACLRDEHISLHTNVPTDTIKQYLEEAGDVLHALSLFVKKTSQPVATGKRHSVRSSHTKFAVGLTATLGSY